MVNIINGLYGFISVPILISFFGKSNYGLIGLAMSINVYLRLMDIGLNSTNVRFFSNWIERGKKDDVNKLFQTSLTFYGLIGLINAIILVILSLFSAQLFHLENEQDVILKHLLYILSISAFISWFTSCFDQLIKANECVGWTQKMGLIPKAFQILVLIITVKIGLSIEVYYALTAFSLFIIIPLCVHKIKQLCPYISFRIAFDKPTFKEILPYCLNIFSFGIFQFSIINLRPVFLGIQGTMEDVADYRVLNGIVNIVTMLGGAFMGVILPSASRAVARGDIGAQDRVAYQGTKYISIALCFFCFGVISVNSELLVAYVGTDYLYLSGWLTCWLLTTLATHNQAISSLILSGTDIRAITITTIVSSIIGLCASWILIPRFGVGGTVIGYGIYLIIQLLFYYFYYWPVIMDINSSRVFFKCFLPSVILGVAAAVIVGFISIEINKWAALLIKGGLFALLYLLGMIVILNRDDKLFFFSILKRR